MSEQSRSYLYSKFLDGEIPTEQDFKDVIDSALNYHDDGLTHTPDDPKNYFGFNDTNPSCIVSIKGQDENDEMICFKSHDDSMQWNINLNPTTLDVPGFSIDDSSSGISTSRLFIDSVSQGNVGIGTTTPLEKLHVRGANDGGYTSAMVTNLEAAHDGYLLAHVDDNVVTTRVGAFTVAERIGSTKVERITVLPTIQTPTNTYYRVGINEKLPYATLQVTRTDVESNVGLSENTGIILSGPIIGTNLALDSFQIQARTGAYVGGGSTIGLTATPLGLQPLGGDIIIHNGLATDKKLTITNDGLVGLGKTPAERLDVNGAVTFGDSISDAPAEGTVRWHTNPGAVADLMVYKGGVWRSLTTQTVTDGFWTAGAISGQIYYDTAAGNPRVGIGVQSPNFALIVDENGEFQSSSAAAVFKTEATTPSPDTAFTRAGVVIENTGQWSSSAANNVGLYVKEVSGQSNHNANLAAVLNGSVVVGNLNGLPLVGANGTNVLAIQSGEAPTTIPGSTANSGIQVFSSEITMGGISTSVFNLMTGDGNLIQLYRQGHLLPLKDVNDPNTSDNTTNDLIKNMRDRINALETVLINLGLLETP
ncbi:MAG TPA: hypothetical protein VL651_16130 [Bacteroidia bacterium]|jgi:hypothetical protein|nr:hypothetical protein [Bacteroidia bacterium]